MRRACGLGKWSGVLVFLWLVFVVLSDFPGGLNTIPRVGEYFIFFISPRHRLGSFAHPASLAVMIQTNDSGSSNQMYIDQI